MTKKPFSLIIIVCASIVLSLARSASEFIKRKVRLGLSKKVQRQRRRIKENSQLENTLGFSTDLNRI